MEEELDLKAHYTVESMPGMVFRVLNYSTRQVPVYDDNLDFIDYDVEEDRDWVIVVAVGDDRKELVETSTISKIDEDKFCSVCGQVGCAQDAR